MARRWRTSASASTRSSWLAAAVAIVASAPASAPAESGRQVGVTGEVALPAGLAAGAHVYTVEEDGGAIDARLEIASDGRLVGADDDGGVDRMAHVRLEEDCPAPCVIAVGAD